MSQRHLFALASTLVVSVALVVGEPCVWRSKQAGKSNNDGNDDYHHHHDASELSPRQLLLHWLCLHRLFGGLLAAT